MLLKPLNFFSPVVTQKRYNHSFCKRAVLTLTFGLCIIGCTPVMPDFHTILSQNKYDKALSTGDKAKFIIVENDFSTDLKLALLTLESNGPRTSEKHARYITDSVERIFFTGVFHFTLNEFEMANRSFEQVIEMDSSFTQAHLLKLDCALAQKEDLDYYQAYQELLDRCSQKIMCDLIKTRYQYVRYHLY